MTSDPLNDVFVLGQFLIVGLVFIVLGFNLLWLLDGCFRLRLARIFLLRLLDNGIWSVVIAAPFVVGDFCARFW